MGFVFLVLLGGASLQQLVGTALGAEISGACVATGCITSPCPFTHSSLHDLSLLCEKLLFCWASVRLELTVENNVEPLDDVPRLKVWSVEDIVLALLHVVKSDREAGQAALDSVYVGENLISLAGYRLAVCVVVLDDTTLADEQLELWVLEVLHGKFTPSVWFFDALLVSERRWLEHSSTLVLVRLLLVLPDLLGNLLLLDLLNDELLVELFSGHVLGLYNVHEVLFWVEELLVHLEY